MTTLPKIYLKTYFYSHYEFPFLILNLIECYPHIDQFLICEYNYTHSGEKREYIFDQYEHLIPKKYKDKVKYIRGDLQSIIVRHCNTGDPIHAVNEPWMRGYFVNEPSLHLNPNDIIISVDADEIIYGQHLPDMLAHFQSQQLHVMQLNLHQFFYKMNYLWKNKDFCAPVIARVSYYKKIPSQWRYDGPIYPKKAGCHFSWCLPVDGMLTKLYSYSHPEYRFCANRELLEDAIENKKYPFNPSLLFEIQTLDLESDLLPLEFVKNLTFFLHTFGEYLIRFPKNESTNTI